MHSVGNGEKTLIRWELELIIDLHQSLLGVVKSKVVEVNGADSLLNGLLESATNAHNLTDGLHGGTEESRDTVELLEIPAWHLDDTVIERRLEAGGGLLGDRVLDLVQWDTETKLGGDKSQWVTGGLGSECGGAGKSGVDLDNAVLLGEWVESILDVTLSNDTEVADNVYSGCAEHVVVFIRQSL